MHSVTESRGDVPAVVVAIAPSVDDRVRIARTLGDVAPVLMVATAEDAVALLGGGDVAERPVPRPVSAVGLSVDSDRRVLSHEGQSVAVSPLEHDLVVCLLEDLGRTLGYGVLHRRVWGNDHLGDRSDVQSVVKRLRHKLRLLGSPLHIDVVRGVGLRLVPAHEAEATTPLAR